MRKSNKKQGDGKVRHGANREYAIHGAKVHCPCCTIPNGDLTVTSNNVQIQGKRTATTADCIPGVNISFRGTCRMAPGLFPTSCSAVIRLGKWMNYAGNVEIFGHHPLLMHSSIPCFMGGSQISIVDSGQVVKQFETEPMKRLRLAVKTEFVQACGPLHCEADYIEDGESLPNEDIRWEVEVFSGKVTEDDEGNRIKESEICKLEDVKLENGTLGELEGKPLSEDANSEDVFKIKGNEVRFNIPKEWGQKEIKLTASIEGEEDLSDTSWEIKVKDHIVAAFFRINPDKPIPNAVEGIKEAEKNYKNIVGTVHHHQGMYKTKGSYYLSGSTSKDIPAYVYRIRENEGDLYDHNDTILFDQGVLIRYRHAGGLQVSDDLLAIGLEEYDYRIVGAFGSMVRKRSVVCFFKGNKELRELRIVRDREYGAKVSEYIKKTNPNKDEKLTEKLLAEELLMGKEESDDFASAVGIIKIGRVYERSGNIISDPIFVNKYFVVVRGDKQGVKFYEIDSDKKNITFIAGVDGVGEFQNVNLYQNELGEIYMFGMGKSKMGGTDTCKIYRVNIREEEKADGEEEKTDEENAPVVESVWIDEDTGEVKYGDPSEENEKNKLVFACKDGTSFHWASCVHIGRNNKYPGGDDLTFQRPHEGFEGIFTIYTVDAEIQFFEIDEIAYDDYEDLVEEYKRADDEYWMRQDARWGSSSPINDLPAMATFVNQPQYRRPVSPQFKCYSFTEDKETPES